jgi:hypothetical protein
MVKNLYREELAPVAQPSQHAQTRRVNGDVAHYTPQIPPRLIALKLSRGCCRPHFWIARAFLANGPYKPVVPYPEIPYGSFRRRRKL